MTEDNRKTRKKSGAKKRARIKKRRIKNKMRFVLFVLIAAVVLSGTAVFAFDFVLDRGETDIIGIKTSTGAPVTAGINEKKARDENSEYGKPLTDVIYVLNPGGRELTLSAEEESGAEFESVIRLPETATKAGKEGREVNGQIYQRVEMKYPDGWQNCAVSTWRIKIPGNTGYRGYESPDITVTAQNIEDLNLNARAACILDRETGQVYYNINMNEKRNQASTTKIVTAVTVLENVDDLSEGVVISKEASETAYSYLHRAKGDVISYEGLLDMAVLASDNGAAVALAEGVAGSEEAFAKIMEKTAKKAGCKVTCFKTSHGLDKRDHYSTAYEVALTLDYAMDNETFRELLAKKKYHVKSISTASQTKKDRKAGSLKGPDGEELAAGEYKGESTNILLGKKGVLGGKTGFTGYAGYCYAGVYEYKDREYITVIMGERGETHRWTDTKKLMKYIREVVSKEFQS